VRAARDAGRRVSVASRVDPPEVAAMTAVVATPTERVVTVKLADRAPAQTVTLAGQVRSALSPARAIRVPPEGAGPLRLTVARVLRPPVTLPRERLRAATAGGGGAIRR
jgi:hypothetical protein